MTFECSNPVFGRTLHHQNKDLTPGGSSGGEGALLASFGSKIGLGTDVGGSVRIPCHFSGLYGLKPSTNRLPDDGHTGNIFHKLSHFNLL